MPCYEVNLISVDLKAADKETLEEALKSLNLKYHYSGTTLHIQTPAGSIEVNNGVAELREGTQGWLNKIKQAYSLKTIEKIAKRYKFTISTKGDNKIIARRY